MSYENAPATIMLATHCACCGRPLVDARSVTRGIGPECWLRWGINDEDTCVSEEQRELCNKLTWAAARYAQQGRISEVRECAKAIRAVGLDRLAELIEKRFKSAERQVKISITRVGTRLVFTTPFRRGEKDEFLAAMRTLPTRRWDKQTMSNSIEETHKAELWEFLRRFFPGVYGRGPDGNVWRVPVTTEDSQESADIYDTKAAIRESI